jgi:hypothetical protein
MSAKPSLSRHRLKIEKWTIIWKWHHHSFLYISISTATSGKKEKFSAPHLIKGFDGYLPEVPIEVH